jgi:hypothetical protein
MTIVQESHPVPEPAIQWWTHVHDIAVQHERMLTPDPTSIEQTAWGQIVNTLQAMKKQLKGIPHTRSMSRAHMNLIQSIEYLGRCYHELSEGNDEESRFYYNNALIQITHLHQYLVDNNLNA